MQNKIAKTIKHLQILPRYQRIFEYSMVMVIREDGLVLWANGEQDDCQSTCAVLMGGAWKAAQAMIELRPKEYSDSSNDIFRLSFDTSEAGVYIVPIKYQQDVLFIGMFFRDETNPGLLKNKFRGLARQLDAALVEEDEVNKASIMPTKKIKGGRLFNDISDDEMDKLFSTAGI